jgi:glycosyltransferase involved in cell wall biosynthesis
MSKLNLTYVTTDSLAEGVGSSQVTPLIFRLAKKGLQIHLITFEKEMVSLDLKKDFEDLGVVWAPQKFGDFGVLGGVNRVLRVSRSITNSDIIHARSDMATAGALLSRKGPVLWDVRSLWADQKSALHEGFIQKSFMKEFGGLESVASHGSKAMSTLTHAIVPVLEARHHKIPKIRDVIPTAVDLDKFAFSPTLPSKTRCLFSGTYNNFYDLELSKKFLDNLNQIRRIDIHWARPNESPRNNLGVGESKIISSRYNEMSRLIPEYSFGISVCKINDSPALKASMPTKIAEFLACGRPMVISAGLGDFDEIIKEFNVGVIIHYEDDLYSKSSQLLDLLSDPETPHRCRAAAEKYFSLDQGVEKYLNLYKLIGDI